MKILKLRVSSEILSKSGHTRLFEYISFVEIQNVFQYDKNNLFLQAKMVVKEQLKKNYKLIENYESIRFLHVLKENGNEVLCLISITTENPLWPDLGAIPWAIIPPIILDPESIHFTFIIPEKVIKRLYKFLSTYADLEILAVENLNKNISYTSPLSPNFTSRQNEIARYAFRNGYFKSPKGIDSGEIAKKFGISSSAVTKHLRSVIRKSMKFLFS